MRDDMPGERALAIESSNPSAGGAGVALAKIQENGIFPLGVEPLRQPARHSDDLMPAIDRLCTREGVAPRDVDLVVVSAGPGGYTGLRIAIVTAQAIAEVAGAACVGVESDRVVARRVDAPKGPFGVCLASKGRTTYVRVHEGATARSTGRLVTSDDIHALGVDLLIADRYLPETIRRVCDDLGIEIRPPRFDPLALLEIGAGETRVGPDKLLPIYPREPDAVTQWRSRKGSDSPDQPPSNCC
jgi:tRNA threonylcarbamoyl adenosine modification protein YeaZ